jgi:hypothetical protein
MGLPEKCGVRVASGIFAIPLVQRKSRQNCPSGAKKLTSPKIKGPAASIKIQVTAKE